MKEILKKIFNNFEEYVAGILLWVMVTVAFINVVSRFTFKFSLAFIEELEIYLYVWLVLLGGAIAFKNWDHLSVSIFVDNLPSKVKKIIYIFVNVIVLIFFAYLLRFGIMQVQDELLMNIKTTSLGIPKWWYSIGVPIGSGIIIIRLLQRTYRMLQGKEDK